jgi:protein involved in polysaccharide export with SLBB domain
VQPGFWFLSLSLALLLGTVASPPVASQTPEQAMQQALLQNPGLADQIRSRIQSSGMTPEQVRARLTASGYPADLLDAYLGPGQSGQPAPGASQLAAVQALGFGTAPSLAMPVDTGLTGTRASWIPAESLAAGNYVFGLDVFRRGATQFLPLLVGPVPPDYKLGPGDQLVVILTGDVLAAYALAVMRDGFILIPQVGQVFVANLTLDQLRAVLYARLGKVYSSVRPDPDAKTHLDVSVTNVRVNQVYVVGEVTQPGAYQISALGTALTALYAAGGVIPRGTMRQLEVRRHDKTVATLDLYDYLLRGEKRDDIRLETGDVIYVPLHGTRAQITGAVLRPAVYELKPGETLADLARAAGGFRADAALARLSIHRIVPLPERGSGPFPRAVVDVRLPMLPAPGQDPAAAAPVGDSVGAVLVPRLSLENGDSVVVDAIPTLDQSFYVTVVGAVNMPGRYPWREGLTLRQLLVQARGPRVGAYLQEAEIARLPEDRSEGQRAQTLRVPLDSTYLLGRDSAGRYLGPPGPAVAGGGTPDVPLAPFDNVLILWQPDFVLQQTVYLTGQIRFPGAYVLASGKDRLAGVIDRAGGLTALAYADGVRFVRTADGVGRIDVNLTRALKERESRYNIILQGGDTIAVPQYQPSVKVTGEVNAPGSVMWDKGKGLDYYLSAAGGPSYKADSHRASVRLANGQIRTRHRVLLFFHDDPTPGPGSEILVPPKDPTLKGVDPVILLGVLAQLVAGLVALVAVWKP